ncbi:MAG TPA: PAS domain S-box protein [Azospirillum sp.]|nr:PAS domain S-box protein [Azospirillum sp.]
MDESVRIFLLDLAKNIGLFALVVLVFLQLRAPADGLRGLLRQALLGCVFGGVAILGMMDPVRLASGLIVDGRNVMAALAGPFGGPLAGVVTALAIGGYRLWLGGGGAWPGVYSITLIAVIGIALEVWLRRTGRVFGWRHLVLLAAAATLVTPSAFLLLPPDIPQRMLHSVLVALIIANALGILMLGGLLMKEVQRQRLADALAESQRRFAATVANVPGGVYQRVLGVDGRLTFPFCSPGFHALVGVPEGEEVTVERLAAVELPDDHQRLIASVQASAKTLSPWREEFRLLRPDGEVRWLSATARPYRRANGDIVWDGILIDVTDRKREEEQLREARDTAERASRLNARFAKAIESTGTGVVITDARRADHPIVFVNPAFTAITGYAADEALGRGGFLLHGADTDPDAATRILEAREAGRPVWVEILCYRKDGRPFWAKLNASPVHDAEGHLQAFVSVIDDVTARKEDERALVRARIEAEAANRAKDDFLAAMSHEIRTPMNGVVGFADLLLGTPLDDRQRRYATHVRDAGRALLTVIDDILDFSRIEAGTLELRAVDVPIRELMAGCEAMVRADAAAKGLALDVAVAPEVPERLRGDPDRLRQVVLNLLGNAVKFTERGSILVNVTRVEDAPDGSPAPDGARLMVRVSDTGIGIPEDRQAQLFHRFVQIDRTRGGTGLGLAISRRIVERMGGAIGVQSRPGIGSTFWFTVALPAAGRADPGEGTAGGGRRAARVLVAEDLAMNRELAVTLLRNAGHAVEAVEDGRAAVEAVRGGAWDLVLMDVQMPVMDGLEATRAIRALPPPAGTIPILAMSAGALPPEVARCHAAGMDGHVAKPIERDDLLEAVDRALAARAPAVPAVPAVHESPPPVLDPSVLRTLEHEFGPERGRALVAEFAADLPARVARVRAAVDDPERQGFEAHAVISLAANVGLWELSSAARALCAALRTGDADAPALTAALAAAADRALAALREV